MPVVSITMQYVHIIHCCHPPVIEPKVSIDLCNTQREAGTDSSRGGGLTSMKISQLLILGAFSCQDPLHQLDEKGIGGLHLGSASSVTVVALNESDGGRLRVVAHQRSSGNG